MSKKFLKKAFEYVYLPRWGNSRALEIGWGKTVVDSIQLNEYTKSSSVVRQNEEHRIIPCVEGDDEFIVDREAGQETTGIEGLFGEKPTKYAYVL